LKEDLLPSAGSSLPGYKTTNKERLNTHTHNRMNLKKVL